MLDLTALSALVAKSGAHWTGLILRMSSNLELLFAEQPVFELTRTSIKVTIQYEIIGINPLEIQLMPRYP